MAFEDLTTYTKVDAGGYLSITSSRLTITGMDRGITTYLYKDKGINHFDGDFEHLVTAKADSPSQTEDFQATYWAVTDALGDQSDFPAIGDGICLRASGNWPGIRIYLFEWDSGSSYTDFYADISSLSIRYYTIKRDESIGTYGTAYVYIYSDSAKTILLDTLSIALHTSKKDFRYIYGTQNFANGSTPNPFTGYVENLDLQEAGTNGFPFFFGAGHY